MLTIVTSAASRGGLPNPRPPKILALHIEGPKIVRCRWCPSARCAEHDLHRERRRVADAIILTPRSQARLSERLKQRAHRSRVHHIVRLIVRLISVVWRDGSVVRSVLSVSRGLSFSVIMKLGSKFQFPNQSDSQNARRWRAARVFALPGLRVSYGTFESPSYLSHFSPSRLRSTAARPAASLAAITR